MLERFIKKLDENLALLSGILIFCLMLVIGADVILRYVFRSPIKWSFEFSTYAMIVIIFLGGGWTLPAGGHVAVDIVVERVKPKIKHLLGIISSIFAIFYLIIFDIAALIYTYNAYVNDFRSSDYIAIPMWPIRGVMFVGGFMLLLEFILRLKNEVKMFIRGS